MRRSWVSLAHLPCSRECCILWGTQSCPNTFGHRGMCRRNHGLRCKCPSQLVHGHRSTRAGKQSLREETLGKALNWQPLRSWAHCVSSMVIHLPTVQQDLFLRWIRLCSLEVAWSCFYGAGPWRAGTELESCHKCYVRYPADVLCLRRRPLFLARVL